MSDNTEILQVSAQLTSNPVANTVNDVVILAAPGAGFRYRIFHIDIASTQNSAAHNMRTSLYFGAVGTIANTLSSQTNTVSISSSQSFYPQGIKCGTNQQVVLRNAASAVGITFRYTLHYFIEEA